MSSPTPPQPNDTAETPAVKTYSEAFVPPPFSYAGPTWYQEPPDMGRADYQPTRPSPPHQATCCHNHSPWESPPSGIGPILPLLLTPATAHTEPLDPDQECISHELLKPLGDGSYKCRAVGAYFWGKCGQTFGSADRALRHVKIHTHARHSAFDEAFQPLPLYPQPDPQAPPHAPSFTPFSYPSYPTQSQAQSTDTTARTVQEQGSQQPQHYAQPQTQSRSHASTSKSSFSPHRFEQVAAMLRANSGVPEPIGPDKKSIFHEFLRPLGGGSYECCAPDAKNGEMCGQVVNRQDRALSHVRMHMGWMPFVCDGSCGNRNCREGFANKTYLQQHINPGYEECPNCNENFPRQNYTRHVKGCKGAK